MHQKYLVIIVIYLEHFVLCFRRFRWFSTRTLPDGSVLGLFQMVQYSHSSRWFSAQLDVYSRRQTSLRRLHCFRDTVWFVDTCYIIFVEGINVVYFSPMTLTFCLFYIFLPEYMMLTYLVHHFSLLRNL